MAKRKEELATGHIYHIFSKSIAGYEIFNEDTEYKRMIELINYYKDGNVQIKFSQRPKSPSRIKKPCHEPNNLVEAIAYCLMPTHIHLLLFQRQEMGISKYMHKVLDSYTRYFNPRHKRKGPLWESKFKNVLVKTDEQLLHLSRYIHLNPVTAYLTEKSEYWAYSSYKEYLDQAPHDSKICQIGPYLSINPVFYRKFVEERADYQRELAKIKHLLLD